MENEKENLDKLSPIAVTIPLKEMLMVCCKSVLIFTLAIFLVGCVAFFFAFCAGLAYSSWGYFLLAAVCAVFIVFGAGFPLDVLTDLMQGGTKTFVLYNDRVVIKAHLKDGRYSEISYAVTVYTGAKETNKYIKAWGSGKSACIIAKRGLTEPQLNAVRTLFKLPATGEAIALPEYAERDRIIPKLESCVQTDGKKCIRTKFDKYYSRDKALLLSRRIISGLLVLPCLFGFVVYGAALRTYNPLPLWPIIVVWAAVIALIADIIWFMYMRRVLKRSEQLERDGVFNDYVIFSDGIVSQSVGGSFFTLAVIRYDKIARVRETTTDIQIDYPTKHGTYPIIKNTLSAVELNTLRALLKSKNAGGETIELDEMPSVDFME